MSGLYFDEEEAISELQARGYRVIKVSYPEVESITNVKGLIEHFYTRRRFYNPDRQYPGSIDYGKDSIYIASFLKSREKLGLDRKMAVKEAAMLVEALFKHEEHLRLKEPIMQPTILTVRPIMDRVCGFLNREAIEVEEQETLKHIEKVNKIYGEKFADRDFKKAAEQRKRMLEKVNEFKRKHV